MRPGITDWVTGVKPQAHCGGRGQQRGPDRKIPPDTASRHRGPGSSLTVFFCSSFIVSFEKPVAVPIDKIYTRPQRLSTRDVKSGEKITGFRRIRRKIIQIGLHFLEARCIFCVIHKIQQLPPGKGCGHVSPAVRDDTLSGSSPRRGTGLRRFRQPFRRSGADLPAPVRCFGECSAQIGRERKRSGGPVPDSGAAASVPVQARTAGDLPPRRSV